MTKEETFAYIKAYLDGDTAVGNIIPLRSVLESAIKYLSEPSLPSNLDEAAEKYERSIGSQDYCYLDVEDAFKAGAEWVAGQGQTFEAHVDNGCAIASGVKLPFVLWNTYEDGDVLKVQIQKKQ